MKQKVSQNTHQGGDFCDLLAGEDMLPGVEVLALKRVVSLQRCASGEGFHLAINTIPALVWTALPSGAVDYLNLRWIEYTGMRFEDAIAWGWMATIHPEDLAGHLEYWNSLLASGKPGKTEARLRRLDGTYLWFLFQTVPLYDVAGNLEKWYGTNIEIEDRKRTETLLAGENRILELISKGEPLDRTLDAICHLVSECSPQSLCSILLVDWAEQRFRHGAAPALPDAYNSAMNGGNFATSSDACARAARLGEQILVSNIAADPVWLDGRELPLDHGLQACWSTPIFSSNDKVVGVFATYSKSPGAPTAHQLHLIDQLTRITSIAIEREHAAAALQASERLARGQLEALASSLTVLSHEARPEKFLEHILRTAIDQLGACWVSVWEMNDQIGCVELMAHYHDGVLDLPVRGTVVSDKKREPAPTEHPVWTEFFETGSYCVHGRILTTPPWAEVAAHLDGPWHDWRAAVVNNPMTPQMIADIMASGVVATLNVPMFVADKVAGFFTLHFTQSRLFREDEIELTRCMANQAMLAMQLYRLSTESRQSAVMTERNRMAREIHDTLAQGFAGIIVQLDAASDARCHELTDEAEAHIARASELARDSLGEARRSVRALRPLALEEETLPLALERMVLKMTSHTTLRTRFSIVGIARDLPPAWEENLLRICQEALHNALCHADAAMFETSLIFSENAISLELHDDGCGFDFTQNHHGFGLIGIRERVEGMAGILHIQSSPGEGTSMQIQLTLK